MHSMLHDIPRFLILFLEELFLIFNQMLSIRAFGRRVNAACNAPTWDKTIVAHQNGDEHINKNFIEISDRISDDIPPPPKKKKKKKKKEKEKDIIILNKWIKKLKK